jgi:hypothetical protein
VPVTFTLDIMETTIPDRRALLIEELTRILDLLQNEQVPVEAIERRVWPYSPYRLHRHLSDIETQIEDLRSELRQRADAPVRCAFSEDRDHYLHMVTGISGEIDRDKKYLKKKAHSTDWMIITDPYFLQWDGPNKAFETEKAYTEFIIDFIPRDLKKLEVFILPGPNRRIFKKFNDRIRSRGTLVSYWETTEIHDRTIIRDNFTGTLMGTSFGGYSNKLSFVLDIPEKDLERFMSELERIRAST